MNSLTMDEKLRQAQMVLLGFKMSSKDRASMMRWVECLLIEQSRAHTWRRVSKRVSQKCGQLRADLAAARKWAKLWKMQATGERIQKEQAAKAFCDEATNRELLQESNNTLRAEIDRLKRGKSCKTCSKFLTPTHTYDSCDGCYWHNWEDGFDGHEPLDPSAAQGGGK